MHRAGKIQTSRYIAVVNTEKKQEIADTCVMGFAGNQRIIGQAGADRGDNSQ